MPQVAIPTCSTRILRLGGACKNGRGRADCGASTYQPKGHKAVILQQWEEPEGGRYSDQAEEAGFWVSLSSYLSGTLSLPPRVY